ERERAVADDDAGRAVVAGERAERVPRDLGVVMAMVVDETGRDGLAADIDGLLGGARQLADLDNLAVLDRHVAVERGHARTVDDAAVLDQHIVGHRFPPMLVEETIALYPRA